jgi:hypothetical protein
MSTGSSTSLAARRKAGLGDPMRAGSRPFQREKSWYNVDGIFVDLTASSSSYVGRYYQPLVNYITSLLPGVMLNPGVYPDQAYANIKVPLTSYLIINVVESSYHSYLSLTVPSWVFGYCPYRKLDLVKKE